MKIFLVLLVSIAMCNCKTNKNMVNEQTITDTLKQQKIEKRLKTMCPENGVCSIKIFKNQSLDVKTDEFGSIYYNKIDNPDTAVILFSYARNVPKGLQDGSYREEIVFEINNNDRSLSLSNNDLQQTKMLYGRFCFCRGQTGNYVVTDGQLNLKKSGDKIEFDLTFKNNKVPQLIGFINEVLE